MKGKTITMDKIIDRADVLSSLQADIPAKAATISVYRENRDRVDEMLNLYDEEGFEAVLEKEDSIDICVDYLRDYAEIKRYYKQVTGIELALALIGAGAIVAKIGKGVFKVIKFLKR